MYVCLLNGVVGPTCFLELVDALCVKWLITRLAANMKVTTCSMITLIENRVLIIIFTRLFD